jgi:hypothetical protein
MNDTFYDLLDRFVAAYLDDLIIYSESDSLEDHIKQVREVLLHCRNNRLFTNAKNANSMSPPSSMSDTSFPLLALRWIL